VPAIARPIVLEEVEAILASGALVIDACRRTVRAGSHAGRLALTPRRARKVVVLVPPIDGQGGGKSGKVRAVRRSRRTPKRM